MDPLGPFRVEPELPTFGIPMWGVVGAGGLLRPPTLYGPGQMAPSVWPGPEVAVYTTAQRKRNLHPQVRAILGRVQREAKRAGLPTILLSCWRSHTEQIGLYEARGSIPVAQPGDSQHEYGYAFDLAAENPNQQGALAGLVMAHGMHWGGEDDPSHFQLFSTKNWAVWLSNARSPGAPGTPEELAPAPVGWAQPWRLRMLPSKPTGGGGGPLPVVEPVLPGLSPEDSGETLPEGEL